MSSSFPPVATARSSCGQSTQELAAQLRAVYGRLEPYRPLLASVALRCREVLNIEHGIDVNVNDALAAAEDFLLALLDQSDSSPWPDATLSLAMQAHVSARCLELEARRALRGPDDCGWDKAVSEALRAVDSVLVRAAAVAADELRRVHGMDLPPGDVLVTVNDMLHELAKRDDGRELGEYQLERRLVDEAVAAFLGARLTWNLSRIKP